MQGRRWQFLNQRENDAFLTARLKLTAWYLLILTSLIIGFTYLTFQAKESAYVRVYTVVSGYNQDQNKLVELQDNYAQFNQRFRERVILLDFILILISGLTSWWLAGRTLKPIALMMEEQTAFAGDVSHGLRTPLASMLLQIDAFRLKEKRITPPVKTLLTDFSQEINHMSRIVEGVLALTRVNVKLAKTSLSRADLNELLVQVKTEMTPLAAAKQQKLEIEVPRKNIQIQGNYDQWLQVLTILTDNAIKYTPDKGKIKVWSESYIDFVKVTVADDGPGVTKQEQKKVFETYYRGKQKAKIGGAGLGLAIAARITSSNGGSIKLTQNKPQGAKLIVKAKKVD